MKTKIFITFFALFFILTNSCSIKRKTLKENLKKLSNNSENIINKLNENELKYNCFSANFSAILKSSKSNNKFSGQIRILKDSLIWISISPLLNIEAFRILITQDSIKYLDRINKEYLAEKFDFINKRINSTFDFNILQSLLTGNDLSFFEQQSFKLVIENNYYKLFTSNRQKLKRYIRENNAFSIPIQTIWLDPETFKINKFKISEAIEDKRSVMAQYEYKQKAEQLIPEKVIIELVTDDHTLSLLTINYSKTELLTKSSFPFNVPMPYSRVYNF